MKIGVFYASTSGNTEVVTDHLIQCFGEENASRHNIEQDGFSGYELYDLLIFGTPTWDYGHLQSDWEARWDEFLALNVEGRAVALFGLGDQYGYPEWYLDAMGTIYQALMLKGARIIGYWPNQGYDFQKSTALTEDGSCFVGLALDEESQPLLTEERVQQWCVNVMEEYLMVLEESCL